VIVLARAKNGTLLGALSTVTGGRVVFRWQGIGTFAVSLPPGPEAEVLTEPGASLVFATDDGGTVLMSGMIHRHEFAFGDKGPEWTVFGDDDSHRLALLAWPVPTAPLTGQSAEAWTMTGPAEAVMKTVVSLNTTRVGRPIAVTIPPSPAGATVRAEARMVSLLDLLPKLGEAGGLGWRVTNPIDGSPVRFDTIVPQDRTGQVLFTQATGTLDEVQFVRQSPTVTRVVVGGSGEGAARVFRQSVATEAEAEWGFIHEEFRDQRQTGDAAVMDQEAAGILAENGDRVRIALKVADTPEQAYGTHYRVGDIVPVEITPGTVVADRVTEVSVSLDPERAGIAEPVLGSGDERPMTAALRRVSSAIRNLERSY
jgi:hypothetical protein